MVAVDSLTILRINFSSSRAPPLRSLSFDLKYPRRQLGRICDRLGFWYIACNEIPIYGNLEGTWLWNSSPLSSALPCRLVENSVATMFRFIAPNEQCNIVFLCRLLIRLLKKKAAIKIANLHVKSKTRRSIGDHLKATERLPLLALLK